MDGHKRALIWLLSVAALVLVSVLGACGVQAATSSSGGFKTVARLDGYDLYVGCVDGDKVYLWSKGVSVIKDDC